MLCQTAVVCTPHDLYPEGITSDEIRRKFGKPDYAKALEQHQAYCRALLQAGVTEIINLANYREKFLQLPSWSD